MVGSGVIYSGGQQCQSTFGFFRPVKQKKDPSIFNMRSENVSIKQVEISKKSHNKDGFIKNRTKHSNDQSHFR